MDKKQNDFLDDLIKYYDSDRESDNSASEADIGATRIIRQSTPAPQEETLGNTIAISPKADVAQRVQTLPEADRTPKKSASEENASGETMRFDKIEKAPDEAPIRPQPEAEPQTPPAQPAAEEVLGNLAGLGVRSSGAVYIPDAPDPLIEDHMPSDAFGVDINDPYKLREEALSKRTGVWYSLKPLWVTLIMCIITVAAFKFYITTDGIIGTYKRNFNYNMGLIFNMFGAEWKPNDVMPVITLPTIGSASPKAAILSDNEPVEMEISDQYSERDNEQVQTESAYNSAKSSRIVPFDGAGSSEISVFNGGVVCAKSNYLCFIDDDGDIVWETDTSISNPIISSFGRYIAVASDGDTKLNLYKNDKLLFSIEVPDPIRACRVSGRGDVVLITGRPSYKGAVLLVNSKGETVFSWSSGVNHITAVNVLKNRRIVVSLVNATGEVTSYVMLFDIKSTDPLAGIELQNSLVYALDTNGKTIFSNGDNSVSCVASNGKVKYDKRYDEVSISHSATDKWGNRAIVYIQQYLPVLDMYNKYGDITARFVMEGAPGHVDIYRDTLIYNNGRDIICGKPDDEKKTQFTASRTIKALKLINSSTFAAVYDDGIEIVKFNNK